MLEIAAERTLVRRNLPCVEVMAFLHETSRILEIQVLFEVQALNCRLLIDPAFDSRGMKLGGPPFGLAGKWGVGSFAPRMEPFLVAWTF